MTRPQTKASNKYNAKAYDRITVLVKKGEKEVIKKYAEEHGQSLNAFITELIHREMIGYKPSEDE